jgi:hypothetical protein
MTMGLLEFLEGLQSENYFPGPSTDFLADAFKGDSFSGVELQRSLIKRGKQFRFFLLRQKRLVL